MKYKLFLLILLLSVSRSIGANTNNTDSLEISTGFVNADSLVAPPTAACRVEAV